MARLPAGSGGNDQPGRQPGEEGFRPQPGPQTRGLYNALRRMLRPRSVQAFILIRHMQNNHYDVTAARDAIIAEMDGRQQNDDAAEDAPAADPEMARAIDMLPPRLNTIEQTRRMLVVSFRDQISARGTTGATLSISQAILLLHLAEWDIGTALDQWKGLDDALDRLHVTFDRMRSPEGADVPAIKNITREDHARLERQDERLAIMLALTERPDWRSIQLFLQLDEIQFDLVRAVVSWFRSGIEIAKKKADRKKTRKDTRCNQLSLPSDADVRTGPADDKWADEPDFFRRVKDFDMSKSDMIPDPPLKEENKNDGQEGSNRPLGFLIYPDRSTIQAGHYYVDDYFVVETICKGKYWHARFIKKSCDPGDAPFAWPKMGQGDDAEASSGDEKKVPFDFNNKRHLSKLNSWRRQQFARNTSTMQRLGHQEWQPIENAKLYLLLKQYYDKYTTAQQDLPADQKSPFKLTTRRLQDITDLLNNTFVGTRPGEGSAVRGLRTPGAVHTQSRRFAPIVEDFKVPVDGPWFEGKRKGKSGSDYKKSQWDELDAGWKALVKWDPTKQRPMGKVVGAGKKAGTNYETGVVAGDDERTKERKRAENRSAAKPVLEAAKAAKEARERLESNVLVGGDEEDEAEEGGGGDEEEDDDEDDDEGEDAGGEIDDEVGGPSAGSKRKRKD